VALNRKSLSELAIHSPHVFDELVKLAQAELTAA
jgi:ribosomal protein L20